MAPPPKANLAQSLATSPAHAMCNRARPHLESAEEKNHLGPAAGWGQSRSAAARRQQPAHSPVVAPLPGRGSSRSYKASSVRGARAPAAPAAGMVRERRQSSPGSRAGK